MIYIIDFAFKREMNKRRRFKYIITTLNIE